MTSICPTLDRVPLTSMSEDFPRNWSIISPPGASSVVARSYDVRFSRDRREWEADRISFESQPRSVLRRIKRPRRYRQLSIRRRYMTEHSPAGSSSAYLRTGNKSCRDCGPCEQATIECY